MTLGSRWPSDFQPGLVDLLLQLIHYSVTLSTDEQRRVVLLSQVVDDGGQGYHLPCGLVVLEWSLHQV